MKIDATFYGCSCGCTPSEYASFEGEDPNIYIVIAKWALNYTVYGNDPCRKLSIPEQSKAILLESKGLSDKIKAIDNQKRIFEHKSALYTRSAGLLELKSPKIKRQR